MGPVAKSLLRLPKNERKKYRDVVNDTFTMLDSALTLVLNRLGDLLQMTDKDRFASELRSLQYHPEWTQLEREVRLCNNLRAAAREMDAVQDRIKGKLSLKDRRSFRELVDYILDRGEQQLAGFIVRSLANLSALADSAMNSDDGHRKAKQVVRRAREKFNKSRMALIEQQVELYKKI